MEAKEMRRIVELKARKGVLPISAEEEEREESRLRLRGRVCLEDDYTEESFP